MSPFYVNYNPLLPPFQQQETPRPFAIRLRTLSIVSKYCDLKDCGMGCAEFTELKKSYTLMLPSSPATLQINANKKRVTQREGRTRNLEIKSLTLCRLS
ncbi:hypothetical protein O9G_001533 [Rozella allomycis CSF55]|uniref:Uncharacterized protein n=1 Tax=Rozella allomycis (strain CSF55) TaxID=988480 RepID=A0A075B4Q9_ROZAC|nr:hypothetical protein O9G_001533 [Rozella allomycis CSF55]|eukprot:EPZ36549.1 hypothetical protein O9G_001533 [Rozella allomycis CSF55]